MRRQCAYHNNQEKENQVFGVFGTLIVLITLGKIVSFNTNETNQSVEILKYKNLLLPSTPLEKEYKAYVNMGRLEKAKKIKDKLKKTI